MHPFRPMAAAIVLLALLPPMAGAQNPAAGRLLVATTELGDSNLGESVVLLLEYDSEGATGVLVNRPTWVTPTVAFPELDFLAGYSGHVYFGGPVAHASLAALVRTRRPGASGLQRVVNDVYVGTSLDALREIVAAQPDEQELRLYAGLVSWGPGQIEREIRRGYWRVVMGDADLIFSPDPQDLWRKISATGSELLVGAPAFR